MQKTQKLFLIALLAVAAFLRTLNPLQYPLAINQDELSNIYDGWSIAQTGQDRWQTPNPFIVRALGDEDNRPALQAWLTAGVFSLTGYSVAAGRWVGAVLGLLSLWLLFLFLKNVFSVPVALAGLAVAAFSPWHILFSRMAHEGAVLPSFFVILILYLWQLNRAQAYRSVWKIALLGLVTGFSANAYQASKVTAFVLAIIIAVDVLVVARKKWLPLALLGITCFLGALPQLYTLYTASDAFFARAKSQGINLSAEGSAWLVIKNIFSNLAPGYLFFTGGQHNNLSTYRLYPVEVAFFYAGLALCVFNVKKYIPASFPVGFIALAALAGILPAALTITNPNALRASGFVILAPIFTISGWFFFTHFIKSPTTKKWANTAGFLLLAGYCLFTAVSFHNSPALRERNQQHYLVAMYSQLEKYSGGYDKILIENTTGESYLYLISFLPIPPRRFQQMEKDYIRAGFDDFVRLGNYYFIKKEHWPAAIANLLPNEKTLLVALHPLPGMQVLGTAGFGTKIFYFMKPGVR